MITLYNYIIGIFFTSSSSIPPLLLVRPSVLEDLTHFYLILNDVSLGSMLKCSFLESFYCSTQHYSNDKLN